MATWHLLLQGWLAGTITILFRLFLLLLLAFFFIIHQKCYFPVWIVNPIDHVCNGQILDPYSAPDPINAKISKWFRLIMSNYVNKAPSTSVARSVYNWTWIRSNQIFASLQHCICRCHDILHVLFGFTWINVIHISTMVKFNVKHHANFDVVVIGHYYNAIGIHPQSLVYSYACKLTTSICRQTAVHFAKPTRASVPDVITPRHSDGRTDGRRQRQYLSSKFAEG